MKKENMLPKILPCWRCNSKASPYGGSGYHCVKCTKCNVTNERLQDDGYYSAFNTIEEAIFDWNKRAPLMLLENELEHEILSGITYKDKKEQGFNEGILLALDHIKKYIDS